MSLQLAILLSRGQVEDFDGGVLAGDVHRLAGLVENSTVGGSQATIEGALFLYHAHVPDLRDAIAVSRNNFVTLVTYQRSDAQNLTYTNVELAAIYGIVVAVESLYILASADIPHRYRLVTRARNKNL